MSSSGGNGAREGVRQGGAGRSRDGRSLRSGSGAWFIHSLRKPGFGAPGPRPPRAPNGSEWSAGDARGSSARPNGVRRIARGDDRRRNARVSRGRSAARERLRGSRAGGARAIGISLPHATGWTLDGTDCSRVSDAGPRTPRVRGVDRRRAGSRARVNARVAMVRACVGRVSGLRRGRAGGVVRGVVRTWRVARPPATFLGATAETREPLKADLEEPTRAGLAAAIDMVRAAIAKSGVTCGRLRCVRLCRPRRTRVRHLSRPRENAIPTRIADAWTSLSRGFDAIEDTTSHEPEWNRPKLVSRAIGKSGESRRMGSTGFRGFRAFHEL